MVLAIEIDFWTRKVTIGGPYGTIWVPMSIAIVFGLAFSKMITLGLVPAMLALPYRIRERRAARRAAELGVPVITGPHLATVPKAQAAE
jgi:multidrug efflux pump